MERKTLEKKNRKDDKRNSNVKNIWKSNTGRM